jgi:hypothetical protein
MITPTNLVATNFRHTVSSQDAHLAVAMLKRIRAALRFMVLLSHMERQYATEKLTCGVLSA